MMLGPLECPVCLDFFNDGSHTPRLLGCGHTVCHLCVERLVVSSSLPRFRCPECRAFSRWRGGIHNFPKNYTLLHALSLSATTPSTPSSDLVTCSSLAAGRRDAGSLLSLSSRRLFPLGGATIPGVLERKLWEIGKLAAASVVLLVFLPISVFHLCFSWWTALLGFMVFCCFSMGVVGIAVFLLFLWWTQSIILTLYRFTKFLFRPVLPEIAKPYS